MAAVPDLLQLVGGTGFKRAGREYHGPCFSCGGVDRFAVMAGGDRPWWICRRCGKHGDAARYLMETEGLRYPDALARLGQLPARAEVRVVEEEIPPAAWAVQMRPLIEGWHADLQGPGGAGARAWLGARGIGADAIGRYWLGRNAAEGRQGGVWCPAGITIPLIGVDGGLYGVKVRRPLRPSQVAAGEDKYRMVSRSHPCLYGRPMAAHRPLLVVEGEFDAIVAEGLLGDLCDVATMGLLKPRGRALAALIQASPSRIVLCLDNDDAGRAAADSWTWHPRTEVVGVPQGKDITEYVCQHHGDLRAWLADVLSGWDATEADGLIADLLAMGEADPAWWTSAGIAVKIDMLSDAGDMAGLRALAGEG